MKKIIFYAYIFLFVLLQSCAQIDIYEPENKNLQVEVIAENLTSVDNIYFSDEGVLYATLERANSRGELVRITNGVPEQLLTGLNRPDGLVGSGHYLFVTEEVMSGRIIRYDLYTHQSRVISTDIQNSEGIDVMANGDLIISEDMPTGRLLRIDQQGHIHVLLHDLPRPEGLCINSEGNIFVALTTTGEIISYDKGLHQTIYAGLNKPDQIECATDGSLWITEDRNPGRLLRLNNGVLQTIMSDLNYPQGIALHQDGSVYIAEQGKDRILKLTWY